MESDEEEGEDSRHASDEEFIDNGDGDDMADMSLYATFDMYAQSRCLGCDAPIPFEAQLCTACD